MIRLILRPTLSRLDMDTLVKHCPKKPVVGQREAWIIDFCATKGAIHKIKGKLQKELAPYNSVKAIRWTGHRDYPVLRRYKSSGQVDVQNTPIVRAATLVDAYDLAPRMRWQDRTEVFLNSGRDPFTALVNGINKSDICQSFEYRGRCIGMFGIGKSAGDPDSGMIWLLADAELQKHPLFKARIGKQFVREGLKKYRRLMNLIHEDTQQDTIDWLKYLGFNMVEKVENHNQRGGTFWRFELE